MHKRSIFRFIVFLLGIYVLWNTIAFADQTIRVAGDENYPPYEFTDRNGVYKGFNVDIMRAIARTAGMKIEIIPMRWKDAVEALEKNKIDVIQGMTKSAIRDKKFNFSKPILRNSQAIFVMKDTNNVSELQDLAGHTVSTQADDISEELIKNIPKVSLVVKSDQEQAIRELLDGSVDAFVGNRLTGYYVLQSLKEFDKVKIIGDPIYSTEYCIAASKKNTKIINLFNDGLSRIKKNGEYDRIYHKWFGETVSDGSLPFKRAALIIGVGIIIAFLWIFLSLHWNRSLKTLVSIRTRELANVNDELKMQQEKLEQNNRLRGKILENILDGIIAFDRDGYALGANIAAKELLQTDIEDGTRFDELKFNNDFIREGYFQALKGNIWRRDLEWQGKNKQTLNIDCNISPIKGPDDAVEGVIIVMHDYTESKLLNEAKEYDKLKTEFFANISHELRTPLSVMFAAIQLLELYGKSDDSDQLRGIIDKTAFGVKQNINRLTRLVNNIIDVTKADTGFLQLQLRDYNIVNVIEEITLSVVDFIENKGISIQFDTDIEEKIIACDIDKIERIILNLLSNSVKFTKAGGSILVKILDGEKFITISVKDTGIGIPKDKQDIIFERFRQVDKSISRNNEGSGIGLSLVKSLVELHDGTIRVESTYGCGSEFIIELPIRVIGDNIIDPERESINTEKTKMEFSDIYS